MSINRNRAVRALLITVSLGSTFSASSGVAQETAPVDGAVPAAFSAAPASRDPWWTLWSRPGPHERIIAGMTTYHVNFRSIG